jgi:hypothetical protein
MPNLPANRDPSTTQPATWNFGQQTCPKEVVTRGVRQLVAGQRRGEAEDPDGYVATIAAILAYYPPSVVQAVTHPVHGLQTRLDWLPKPSELKRACDAESHAQWQRAEREKAARAPRLSPPDEPTPAERARIRDAMAVFLAELRGRGKIVGGADEGAVAEAAE